MHRRLDRIVAPSLETTISIGPLPVCHGNLSWSDSTGACRWKVDMPLVCSRFPVSLHCQRYRRSPCRQILRLAFSQKLPGLFLGGSCCLPPALHLSVVAIYNHLICRTWDISKNK